MSEAVEYFLWVDGVPGDCANPNFHRWHDVVDFRWDGGGELARFGISRGTGLDSLVVHLPRTEAAAALAACAQGREAAPKAVVASVTVEGDVRHLYAKIVLLGARLSGYRALAARGKERPLVRLTIRFEKVQFVHYPAARVG